MHCLLNNFSWAGSRGRQLSAYQEPGGGAVSYKLGLEAQAAHLFLTAPTCKSSKIHTTKKYILTFVTKPFSFTICLYDYICHNTKSITNFYLKKSLCSCRSMLGYVLCVHLMMMINTGDHTT